MTHNSFEYTRPPGRVVFGSGALADVPREVRALGCARAFVLSGAPESRGTTARLLEVLGDLAVGESRKVVMHTPLDVTEHVLRSVREVEPDCLVSLSGGSATGLSKGPRVQDRSSTDRDSHDLRGLRGDPDPRPDRRRQEDDAAQGLLDLTKALSAPTSLESIGMSEAGLADAAEIAAAAPITVVGHHVEKGDRQSWKLCCPS
jgi:alcohol dehydrogenase class IV